MLPSSTFLDLGNAEWLVKTTGKNKTKQNQPPHPQESYSRGEPLNNTLPLTIWAFFL